MRWGRQCTGVPYSTQITHQKIRKELRNILEYFIFGDSYFLVEYLNFCLHRIGWLIALILVFLVVIFYASLDFIVILLFILNYFITISLLYYFGVELCHFRGDIRLRIVPYWAYLTVWSVEFWLSIFAFLVNFIVGFCIGRLPGTCKSSNTKSQENWPSQIWISRSFIKNRWDAIVA
jgi:hypothetical protein